MAKENRGDIQLDDASNAADKTEVELLRQRVKELESRDIAPSNFSSGATEVYAGEVPKLDPEGNEIPGETEPAYFYRVDLPPSGGTQIVINGNNFYHGEQYKVRVSTLRTMKEIIFRGHQHEASIRGSNENFYRSPQDKRIGSRA
jgi:hypothetical protein